MNFRNSYLFFLLIPGSFHISRSPVISRFPGSYPSFCRFHCTSLHIVASLLPDSRHWPFRSPASGKLFCIFYCNWICLTGRCICSNHRITGNRHLLQTDRHLLQHLLQIDRPFMQINRPAALHPASVLPYWIPWIPYWIPCRLIPCQCHFYRDFGKNEAVKLILRPFYRLPRLLTSFPS